MILLSGKMVHQSRFGIELFFKVKDYVESYAYFILLLFISFLLLLELQNYTDYVGRKSTFRLLNRGSAKALDKVAELYGRSALPFALRPFSCGRSMLIICILQMLERRSSSSRRQSMTS